MKKRLIIFARSLIISGIVFVVAMGIIGEDPVAGALLLALYSTFIVVFTYRKPIPLGYFTALLPGLMALMTFLDQANLLGVVNSLPIFGILTGVISGLIMGLAHRVYSENGRVYARRTLMYLMMWGLSCILIQISGLFGVQDNIIDLALALNGFTATSLIVLSLFLCRKYRKHAVCGHQGPRCIWQHIAESSGRSGDGRRRGEIFSHAEGRPRQNADCP